jgi:hypothetical protein
LRFVLKPGELSEIEDEKARLDELQRRNRYRACLEAGITPRYVEFNGVNPWRYVWSLNGERRHFGSAEQKYLCYAALEEGAREFERIAEQVRDAGNRKRSETQKGIPKEERGATTSGSSLQRDHADKSSKNSTAKATSAHVHRGAVERMDSLKKTARTWLKKSKAGS